MYRIFDLKMIHGIDVLRSKLLAILYTFLVRSLGVHDFTVILCCKNAASSIKLCVESIRRAGGQNLIIVDGWSTDGTQEILKSLNEFFHLGAKKGLSYDCQIGIDLCTTEYAFFVDADHVIPDNFFNDMFSAYQSHGCDFLQSKLSIYEPKGIFNFGENEYYKYVHNIHWTSNMIGTSPSLFRVKNLQTGGKWQFYSPSANVIGDTSWAKRTHDKGAIFHVGGPIVKQIHAHSAISYFRKFKWYGQGDADFVLEYPNRCFGIFFHLVFRYPIIYGVLMLRHLSFRGFLFVIFQGHTRFYYCVRRLILKLLRFA